MSTGYIIFSRIARWREETTTKCVHISVCIATGWCPEGLEFDSRQRQEIDFSPWREDRFWGPSSLLSNGYWCLIRRGYKTVT
jgi:hypothetical protein